LLRSGSGADIDKDGPHLTESKAGAEKGPTHDAGVQAGTTLETTTADATRTSLLAGSPEVSPERRARMNSERKESSPDTAETLKIDVSKEGDVNEHAHPPDESKLAKDVKEGSDSEEGSVPEKTRTDSIPEQVTEELSSSHTKGEIVKIRHTVPACSFFLEVS